MRASGILLPVSSLPGAYGIGGFTKEAYEFIDWLRKAGQKYWQILPLGPTGYGDSPYQAFSTFAGNPYFISLDELCAAGLITDEERADQERHENESEVDYGDLFANRFNILKRAYERFEKTGEVEAFCEKHSDWLGDYALYRVLKHHNGGNPWYEWERKYKFRYKNALNELKKNYADEIGFYFFLEYEFDRQWSALKSYANERGIEIIGDLPIYVSADSADAWSNPKLFKFDKDLNPTVVAGCPPDYFSPSGQLWGNPVYNWKYHKKTGYEWWIKRLSRSLELYDVLRLDHFRGFASYYEVPFGSETAINGQWMQGPGMNLFNEIKSSLGDGRIIAEDLGMLTDDVFELIKTSGYPGMKVLEFAFGSGSDNLYLPHNQIENSVVYTGTHDNETLIGWLENADEHCRWHVAEYLGHTGEDNGKIADALIRSAYSSVADTCIIPIQDYLGLGNEARINTPATADGNWKWRMEKGSCTDALAERIQGLTGLYGR